MLEEYSDKKTSYITKYDSNELINDMDDENDLDNEKNKYDANQSSSEATTFERPKFKPTNATQ
jgi:hypothetical protein